MIFRWTAAYYWILPGCKTVVCFSFLLIIKLWVMCNWIQTNMHILTNSWTEDFLFQEGFVCITFYGSTMPRDSFCFFLRFHVEKEHTILPKTTRKYYQLPKDLIFQLLRSCNAATRRDFLFVFCFKSGNVDNKCLDPPKDLCMLPGS